MRIPHRHFALLFTTGLVVACATSSTSTPSPTGRVIGVAPGTVPKCAPSGGDTTGTVYFEFQVDRPVIPRPGSSEPPPLGGEVLIEFVVDTAGRVDLGTVKVMQSERADATRRLREALPTLEFEPALRQRCRVRQLAQRPYR